MGQWRPTDSKHRALSLFCVVVVFASGCAGPLQRPTAQEAKPDLVRAQQEAFASNLESLQFITGHEQEIVAILESRIERGFELLDSSLIEPSLDDAFERHFVHQDETVSIETKQEFIEQARRWKKSETPVRNVTYAIKDIKISDDQSIATVVALSTYESEYFSPRFLEILAFKRGDGHWKLGRQALALLHPIEPALHDPQIFVADVSLSAAHWTFKQQDLAILEGPDALVEWAISKSVDSVLGNEKEYLLLVVFREPPVPGSRVRVEHQFERPWAKNLRPYVFSYVIENSDPYLVVANGTRAGGSGGTITYTVFLDGLELARKTVNIR